MELSLLLSMVNLHHS